MTSSPNKIRLAVVGAHLRGQPLNHQLTDLGAAFVRATRTAPVYRMYALSESDPPKPGLLRVAPGEGAAMQVEVWELIAETFGAFIEKVPAPLTIGTVELEDGESVKGFLCEAYVIPEARDITEYGGWQSYLERAH